MNVPIPAIAWSRAYDRAWLRADLVAGVTTAAVVVPQAMAYADIAGLPLAVGLYTVLVPLSVYAVMRTFRHLSVTTTSTIATLTAGALHEIAPGANDEAGSGEVSSQLGEAGANEMRRRPPVELNL